MLTLGEYIGRLRSACFRWKVPFKQISLQRIKELKKFHGPIWISAQAIASPKLVRATLGRRRSPLFPELRRTLGGVILLESVHFTLSPSAKCSG